MKLFLPGSAATWLLTETDPDDPDIAFVLCDLGLGFPEIGSVRRSELESLRSPLGLAVERARTTPCGTVLPLAPRPDGTGPNVPRKAARVAVLKHQD